MRWGRAALGLLGSVALVAAGGVAAWVWVGQADFAALAAERASAALGRSVQVGTLRVAPGRWLRIEASGLRLDNVDGGTRPAMATLERLAVEVEAVSLLRGPAVVRRLELDGLQVLLERGAGGVRNWRFGPLRPDGPAPPAVAAGSPRFPLLRDVRLRGSEVAFRTPEGTLLRVRLDDAALVADGVDAPVRLQVAGAYQDVPLTLHGDLDPTAVLRRAMPFGAKLHFGAQGSALDFDGTMLAPLDLDGASGALTLDAADGGPLLRMMGVRGAADPSLRLAGTLEHTGGNWAFTGGTGTLNGDEVQAASLTLQEGDGGKPDRVQADVAFTRLDLNELLGSGPHGKRSSADIPLRVDPAPDTLVDLHLTADVLDYGEMEAQDAVFSGALEAGRAVVRELALTYLGARAQASGRVVGAESGAQVSAELLVGGADVRRLRRALGFGAIPVQGRLSAQIEAQASGATLNAAVRSARVSAVVALAGGSIAREVVEMASTDVRLLFRSARGSSQVGCMLAALDMRGGVGTLSPLRVRSADGTIAGYGRFDLHRRVLDLSIGSEAGTTSSYALDIPVRVSGTFAKPDVRPARWSGPGRAALASMDAVAQLPPVLQAVARRSGCSRR